MGQKNSAENTPMMRQFFELKNQYPDCILFFRAGDFYETFYDDAKICASLLSITLTKRADIPMAGVPFHSVTPYIRKLLQNNYKVAICEQLEDPNSAKGLVKRGITRILTPGTIIEDEYLDSYENNYIMCIYSPKDISEKYGVSVVDITTGEFITSQVNSSSEIKTLIGKFSPTEIIFNESYYAKEILSYVKNSKIYYNFLSEVRFNYHYSKEIIKKQFGYSTDEIGLSEKEYASIASGALLFYIYKLQKLDLDHINKITYSNLHSNMILDSTTLRNLEVTESVFTKDKKKTLFGILNNTKTAPGSRLLKKHILNPLLEKNQINERLDAVEELNGKLFERNDIREQLSEVSDIERITSRINSGFASPKDLYALKITLQKIPQIKENLMPFNSKLLKKVKKIDQLSEIVELLDKAIVEDAPAHTRDIGYLKKDYNQQLKELFDIAYNSRDYIKELEEEERLRTGINSLKVRYNKVIGYYIEIPKTWQNHVPSDYETKQTLVNAQRYVKEDFKEKENQILNSEEKIKALERELYDEILSKLKRYTKKLQEISSMMALLDVLITHSINAQSFDYIRPTFDEEETNVVSGRNPIVEQFEKDYTPNDAYFGNGETVKIVSGPNMAGKSTYLRQNALIAIMAQTGSFVPAKSAKMKIYDRVFTRIGAHDVLAEGQSTFMVEMSETANILNNVTENSIVLLDEIGRGTSTYDGLAIAWAVTEELAKKDTDTIFATHYHQLNKLSEFYSNIENYNVAVREEGENIEFIHKIVKGGTDKSYGIYVAKIAGVPYEVVDRAKEVQKNIEEGEEIKVKKEVKEVTSNRSKSTKKKDSSKNLDEFFWQ